MTTGKSSLPFQSPLLVSLPHHTSQVKKRAKTRRQKIAAPKTPLNIETFPGYSARWFAPQKHLCFASDLSDFSLYPPEWRISNPTYQDLPLPGDGRSHLHIWLTPFERPSAPPTTLPNRHRPSEARVSSYTTSSRSILSLNLSGPDRQPFTAKSHLLSHLRSQGQFSLSSDPQYQQVGFTRS